MTPQWEDALRLIRTTPGYAPLAQTLAQLAADGKILFSDDLPDRAVTHLSGAITVGREAADAHPLGFAETLVHESHHRTQNPLQKTASYWKGIATGTNPMLRYEQPAYQAGLDFLVAAERAHPEMAAFARQEIEEVKASFTANYGGVLYEGTVGT